MTILAGVISRKPGLRINEITRNQLVLNITRNHRDHIHKFESERFCFLKVDIEVFEGDGIVENSDKTLSMVAGEPILVLGPLDERRSRNDDLKKMVESISGGDVEMLSKARGTFCAIHYEYEIQSLTLISDLIGVRSLYYWSNDDFVVFATALRILESVSLVPKETDIRGMGEEIVFGESLSERTRYKNINVLKSAQVVQFTDSEKKDLTYYKLGLNVDINDYDSCIDSIYRTFNDAVRLRLREDKTSVAFLSGGLDSRVIVAELRNQGAEVHTLNFAPEGTQDQVFGADFAKAIGTRHRQGLIEDNALFEKRMYASKTWGEKDAFGSLPPERPCLVWSGDGGSVGLGHVYLNKESVDLAEEGKLDRAIESLIKYNSWVFPGIKALKNCYIESLKSLPFKSIKDEIISIESSSHGKKLYLFLMLNDQRRHLAKFYEDIDLIRYEMQLPFFDSKFLIEISKNPIDYFLLHKLYVDWLRKFSPVVSDTPWQAYPNHTPCPLPLPSNLRYQWGAYLSKKSSKKSKSYTLKKSSSCFLKFTERKSFYNKFLLFSAYAFTATGIKDLMYILSAFVKQNEPYNSKFNR